MRVICYWKYDLKDTNEVLKKSALMQKLQEKYPDWYAKSVNGPFVTGGCGKGITILEADSLDQFGRMCVFWLPEISMDMKLCFESARQMELKMELDKTLAEIK